MKQKQLILLLITISIIMIMSIYVAINYFIPKETKIIEYDFQIDSPEKAGFNLDKDKLHFGITCPGCIQQRKIIIQNKDNYVKKIKVYVLAQNQDSANYFSINPSSGAIINASQKQEYTITLTIPQYVTPTQEEGKIIIKQYRTIFN